MSLGRMNRQTMRGGQGGPATGTVVPGGQGAVGELTIYLSHLHIKVFCQQTGGFPGHLSYPWLETSLVIIMGDSRDHLLGATDHMKGCMQKPLRNSRGMTSGPQDCPEQRHWSWGLACGPEEHPRNTMPYGHLSPLLTPPVTTPQPLSLEPHDAGRRFHHQGQWGE